MRTLSSAARLAALALLSTVLVLLPTATAAEEGGGPDELTDAALQALLDSDPTARLDRSGRLLYADRHESRLAGPETPARAVAPLGQTFRLHSRPGSPRVIYLDFDGERVCGTAWNDGGLLGPVLGGGLPCATYPGFAGRTGQAGFSTAELRSIQEVWARVSEDYAPFDVDVTTEHPGQAAIHRSSTADRHYGVHAVVSASAQARNSTCGGPGCAGVAYVGIFPDPTANDARILWAFPEELGNSPRRLADVLSHEAGHTLGLNHDGRGGSEYYAGHGIWAPIMGAGDRQLTQWSRGEYAGATEQQDDLAVMARHGIARLRDDHGDVGRRATLVRRGKLASGLIGTSSDTDAFAFRTSCRGRVKVRARNATQGPNLDLRMRVKRPGRKARTIDPLSAASGTATGLDATWSGRGKRGRWVVSLTGTGARNPASDGYSRYGSLGRYTVKVSGRCVRR